MTAAVRPYPHPSASIRDVYLPGDRPRWRRGRTDYGHPWLAPRCVCQWPDTEHCRAGNHARCYVREPWPYAESTLRWANGSPVIDRSVPRAEWKPVEVWHARWTCKWRCRCDCHTPAAPPAPAAPEMPGGYVQPDLFADA